MNPIVTRSSTSIDVPVEFAWEFLSRYERDVRWRSGLVRMQQRSAGEVHQGALVDETLRVMGRTVQSVVEVTAVRPGRSFSWRVLEGSIADGSRTLTADGPARCRLDLEKRVTLVGSDRWLRPVVSPVIHRTEGGDVQRAKHVIELSWHERLQRPHGD